MFENPVFLLIAGLVLLLAGGEFLVRGGVSLASNFRISTLVVGVTVVSLGTSAPELVVSIDAALSGHPDIAMGNVIGSNIANIGLVLGITIVIMPVIVDSRSLLLSLLVMIGVTLLLIFFVAVDMELDWYEGLILLGLLVAFVWHSVSRSRKKMRNGIGEIPERKYPLYLSLIIVVVSGIALVFGAQFLVGGASEIARHLGVSERAIAVSVIALGTSLPELATSAVAAFRKQSDISIGNIVGSNIYNILAILGTSSGILGIPGVSSERSIAIIPELLQTDLIACLIFSLALVLFLMPPRKTMLQRYKGIILLLFYVLYIYIVFR